MHQQPYDLKRIRQDAKDIFYAGLKAVEPAEAVIKHCRIDRDRLTVGRRTYDLAQFRNIYLIGAGKASAPMAAVFEQYLAQRITAGIINVKYGHVVKLARVELNEAGHPVPDENGQRGACRMLELADRAGKKDLVICLMSGGGSALLPLPGSGLTLEDKQAAIRVLLACGASIHEINAVRKHLSRIKGGKLATRVYPAQLVCLMLSDVVGDDLDVIASGPTTPDSSRFQDCMQIIDRYQIAGRLPGAVIDHIRAGMSGRIPESPKADHPAFETTQNLIIGNNMEAIIAAKSQAEQKGYHTLVLSSMIEGETRAVARVHSAIAREVLKTGHPIPSPACILSGGETTVTLTGKGLGGRNLEFSLAAAIDIQDTRAIVILSAGTDGTDGPTDAAGAIADSETLKRARAMGMDPQRLLDDNDSYHFFERLGDLFKTGPTNTNVMDLRIILVGPCNHPDGA